MSSNFCATSKLSQDVFLEPDGAGRISLAESNNAGNHFFRSLAELNRTKFIDQDAGDRVALSMVHTIWNKGQGKIYFRAEQTDEWRVISKIGEAQNLVLLALETLFGVETHQELLSANAVGVLMNEQVVLSSEEVSSSSSPMEHIPSEQCGAKERRHSANTLEAASSLLLVQEAAGELDFEDSDEDEPPKEGEQEEKTELQVKFENSNIPMVASFDSSSSASPPSSPESDHAQANGATAGTIKKPEKRRRSACKLSDFVANQPGLEFSNVSSNDVLCGGSGEGVLAIRHEGNKRFLKALESEMEDFHKSDDRGKLRIAQQAVEHSNPRGRFLAYNPETGLWHQLMREKAWFKSLRTFLKRLQRIDADQLEMKQRSLPRPLER